jgi:hypothetical protein
LRRLSWRDFTIEYLDVEGLELGHDCGAAERRTIEAIANSAVTQVVGATHARIRRTTNGRAALARVRRRQLPLS